MSLEESIKQIVNDAVDAKLASLPPQKVESRILDANTLKEVREFQLISNKPYLTKQELAIYFDCTARSIEEWSQRADDKNPLPVVRVGRDIRIKREKADEWMEREGERFWRLKSLKAAG